MNSRRQRKGFLTMVVYATVFSFIYNNIVWAQGDRGYIQRMMPPEAGMPISELRVLDNLGKIKEVWNVNDGQKRIIHIQDSHANYEAQINIAKILEQVVPISNKVLIALEGADGEIDTSQLASIPRDDVKKAICDNLAKSGYLTGAEYYSAFNPKYLVWGVEDSNVYLRNLEAFKRVQSKKPKVQGIISDIEMQIDSAKKALFSDEQINFINKMSEYQDDGVGLEEYIGFLNPRLRLLSLGAQIPNIKRLIRLIYLKKRIDFSKIDNERMVLLRELKKRMVKEELVKVITKGLEYQIGQLSSLEYFVYLGRLKNEYYNGVNCTTRLHNLDRYIKYIRVESQIDRDQLFYELRQVENSLADALFVSKEQRRLYDQIKELIIIKKFLDLKIYREDLNYYKENREDFYKLGAPALKEFLKDFEEFCDLGIKRDQILVENTLRKMEEDKIDTAVLITGGFHTKGMTDYLKDKEISYAVISPRIIETQDKDRYVSLMLCEKSPLEKILEFNGTRLALPVSSAERPINPKLAVWIKELIEAELFALLAYLGVEKENVDAERIEKYPELAEKLEGLVSRMPGKDQYTRNGITVIPLLYGEEKAEIYVTVGKNLPETEVPYIREELIVSDNLERIVIGFFEKEPIEKDNFSSHLLPSYLYKIFKQRLIEKGLTSIEDADKFIAQISYMDRGGNVHIAEGEINVQAVEIMAVVLGEKLSKKVNREDVLRILAIHEKYHNIIRENNISITEFLLILNNFFSNDATKVDSLLMDFARNYNYLPGFNLQTHTLTEDERLMLVEELLVHAIVEEDEFKQPVRLVKADGARYDLDIELERRLLDKFELLLPKADAEAISKLIQSAENPYWTSMKERVEALRQYVDSYDGDIINELRNPIDVYGNWSNVELTGKDGSRYMPKIYRVRIRNNTVLGPAKGGIRYIYGAELMKNERFVEILNQLSASGASKSQVEAFVEKWINEESMALSLGMTLKTGGVRLPLGGGKGAVFMGRIDKSDSGIWFLENYNNSNYRENLAKIARSHSYDMAKNGKVGINIDIPAPDVNTGGEILAWYADEYFRYLMEETNEIKDYTPELYSRLKGVLEEGKYPVTAVPLLKIAVEYSKEGNPVPWLGVYTGKPVLLGGSLGRVEATGFGGVDVMRELIPGGLEGKTVSIQGFGNVGAHTAYALSREGAVVQYISDHTIGLYKEEGFSTGELEKMLKWVNEKGRSETLKEYYQRTDIQAKSVGEQLREWTIAVLSAPVDILIPAALEDQITVENVHIIRAKMIVELANGPVTTEAEKKLYKKGIPVIHDTLANAGGVVVSSFETEQAVRGQWYTQDVINSMRREVFSDAVHAIRRKMKESGIDSYRIAGDLSAVTRIAIKKGLGNKQILEEDITKALETANSDLVLNMIIKGEDVASRNRVLNIILNILHDNNKDLNIRNAARWILEGALFASAVYPRDESGVKERRILWLFEKDRVSDVLSFYKKETEILYRGILLEILDFYKRIQLPGSKVRKAAEYILDNVNEGDLGVFYMYINRKRDEATVYGEITDEMRDELVANFILGVVGGMDLTKKDLFNVSIDGGIIEDELFNRIASDIVRLAPKEVFKLIYSARGYTEDQWIELYKAAVAVEEGINGVNAEKIIREYIQGLQKDISILRAFVLDISILEDEDVSSEFKNIIIDRFRTVISAFERYANAEEPIVISSIENQDEQYIKEILEKWKIDYSGIRKIFSRGQIETKAKRMFNVDLPDGEMRREALGNLIGKDMQLVSNSSYFALLAKDIKAIAIDTLSKMITGSDRAKAVISEVLLTMSIAGYTPEQIESWLKGIYLNAGYKPEKLKEIIDKVIIKDENGRVIAIKSNELEINEEIIEVYDKTKKEAGSSL